MKTFNQFNLSSDIKKALELLDYRTPTDIQIRTIPQILDGKDVVVKSKTGSGKTAAFTIPLLEKVIWDMKDPQVLILSPTRELAMQIKEEAFNIGRFKRIKTACIYGKSNFENQIKVLKQRNHFIVATPGRLIDHISRKTVNLNSIKYIVIDEADEMLKMGFIDQIEEILKKVKYQQLIMVSATMDDRTLEIIKKYSHDPIYIEEDISDNQIKLKQSYMVVDGKKEEAMLDFIKENKVSSAIIFCNTQERVDLVYDFLSNEKMLVKKLHGGLEQRIRTKTINDFKEGKVRYVVATDVAARGLDISNLSFVFNIQMPEDFKTYMHRVGRTARMHKDGNALTLLTETELESYLDIMKQNDIEVFSINQVSYLGLEDIDLLHKPIDMIKKDEKLNQDIFKIHINAGKKTKMRASDIVGTLCAIEGVSAADIGVISILDISTFVDIMHGKGLYVLEQLQDKPIKGRLRHVSKVEQ